MGEPMPKYVWLFKRPDGHWEVRFQKPDVPATEYTRSQSDRGAE